jgi:hypothetical protein
MSNLWIFTSDGFYSSRQDEWCKEDEVMIRARVYEDLLALADQLGMEDPQIIRIKRGDYLYRMKVKQDDWCVYCAHAALNHLEGEGIKDTDDDDRFMAYLRIWEIMCSLQNVKDAEKRGNKREEDKERNVLTDMCWPDYHKPNPILPPEKYQYHGYNRKTDIWIKKQKKKNIKRRQRYA